MGLEIAMMKIAESYWGWEFDLSIQETLAAVWKHQNQWVAHLQWMNYTACEFYLYKAATKKKKKEVFLRQRSGDTEAVQ